MSAFVKDLGNGFSAEIEYDASKTRAVLTGVVRSRLCRATTFDISVNTGPDMNLKVGEPRVQINGSRGRNSSVAQFELYYDMGRAAVSLVKEYDQISRNLGDSANRAVEWICKAIEEKDVSYAIELCTLLLYPLDRTVDEKCICDAVIKSGSFAWVRLELSRAIKLSREHGFHWILQEHPKTEKAFIIASILVARAKKFKTSGEEYFLEVCSLIIEINKNDGSVLD